MAVDSNDSADRVSAAAGRLRLIQIDLADETPEVRREYLSEQIERAMADMVPADRQAFLESLGERFPTWDRNVETVPTAAASPTDQRELSDPSFLVSRLVALAPSMSDAEKKAVADRLAGAGIAAAGGGGFSLDKTAQIKAALRMEESESVDVDRAAELLVAVVEFANSLDQVVWRIWKQVAPKSDIRRSQLDAAKLMQQFVAGDREVTRAQVKQELENLRRLIASLLSAIGQLGRAFAQRHLSKFSPTEIEALASMESGGFLVAREVKNWRKYVELAGTLDEAEIEGEMMRTTAELAEKLIKGLGR